MKRREFIKVACTSAFGTMMAAGCSDRNKTVFGKPPNIIFFLTDDQRWDAMGCAGNTYIQTPNIDKLAAEGVRFSNAFVTTPICCTSRASIFSGQYARRHGIHDFIKDFSPEAYADTYPALFRKFGYRTGFVGKYGVGTQTHESDFDVWHGIPGQPVYEHTDENGNYKHLTNIMGDQVTDFIKNADRNSPFCLSVSFKAPHVQDEDPRQFLYDKSLEKLYEDVEVPLPTTARNEYFEDLPDFLQNSEARKRWQMRFSSYEKSQESIKGYYRLVTGVDRVLGRIRKQLEASGAADNTIILLMGDNGFFLGEKGLAGKWYPLEESIRVPLIIYDPRQGDARKGRVLPQMALNIDIAPTMLDMAGIDIPRVMQGKSLCPLLNNQVISWRKDFLIEHLFEHPTIVKSEALRTEKWKYIRYLVPAGPYEEFYDLEKDPLELNSLAEISEYTDKKANLRNRCDELIQDFQKSNS